MGDLTKDFSQHEFKCKCKCDEVVIHRDLLYGLQNLRKIADAKVIIKSAFRCSKHNEAIGGAKNSYHVQGKAADIVIEGKSLKEMYSLAFLIPEFRNGGIGLYPEGFIHVDVRESPGRWGRINGKYVAIEKVLEGL